MKIRHQLRYDAPPRTVHEMRSDPDFRARVCRAMETVSHDVTVDDADGELQVRVDMVQRTPGVPGFARKFVGDETRVVQTERWPSADGGRIEVEIPGKPGRIHGTLSLAAEGEGSLYVFEGEATVNIPLVGGKLEGLVKELFVDGMDTEQRVAAAWLKEDGR